MNSDEKIQYVIGQELHTVSIHDGSGDVHLGQLREANADLVANKKEICEKVFHLGVALTGSPERAMGFLMGWLTKSIKSSREKSDNSSWKINHEKIELSKEELAEQLATLYENIAALLREKKSTDAIDNNPLVRGSGNDGTDLF